MTSPYSIRELHSFVEMKENFELLLQLNSEITKDRYEEMLREMIAHGYFQVGIYDAEKCIGLSGIWINTKIYSGKYIELDNVVVDKDYRSKGIGKILCDWAIQKAKDEGCNTAMLDAYVENRDAHRFYYREGFHIRGFHFLKRII